MIPPTIHPTALRPPDTHAIHLVLVFGPDAASPRTVDIWLDGVPPESVLADVFRAANRVDTARRDCELLMALDRPDWWRSTLRLIRSQLDVHGHPSMSVGDTVRVTLTNTAGDTVDLVNATLAPIGWEYHR